MENLNEKIILGQMMLALYVIPRGPAHSPEVRRRAFLASQRTALAFRTALWRLEQRKVAQDRKEAATFAEAFGWVQDAFALMVPKDEKKEPAT